MTGVMLLALWCGTGAAIGTFLGIRTGRLAIGVVLGTFCGIFGWLLLLGAEPRRSRDDIQVANHADAVSAASAAVPIAEMVWIAAPQTDDAALAERLPTPSSRDAVPSPLKIERVVDGGEAVRTTGTPRPAFVVPDDMTLGRARSSAPAVKAKAWRAVLAIVAAIVLLRMASLRRGSRRRSVGDDAAQ
jgi:hypothetical protein